MRGKHRIYDFVFPSPIGRRCPLARQDAEADGETGPKGVLQERHARDGSGPG